MHLALAALSVESLPLGEILCVVDLTSVVRIDGSPLFISDQERAFGDYTPGRFMWMTGNLRRAKKPIPWKGRQGLFDVPDDILAGAEVVVSGSFVSVDRRTTGGRIY